MSERIAFRIDGTEVQGKPGQTILAAADDAGVYIPRLCAFKGLSPFGSCRICTVMVNGRPQAACTQPISPGMTVENDTEKLLAIRRDIIEMLFVEGNHYCMFCEKSGNCELQALAYRFGILAPRFPYLFPEREVDASHPDILIDHNRCILCARCVRASRELDGKNVFQFVGRSSGKRVAVNARARLVDTNANVTDQAVSVCPVGALLRKRVGYAVPVGKRIYDRAPIGSDIEAKRSRPERSLREEGIMAKPKIATTSLAGCFGCHMSLLDIDERILKLVELIDFNRSPINDIKTITERCLVGLVEGGCANEENVHVLQEFRENCDILISVGDCATMGGIPALRNTIPLRECLEEAYLKGPTVHNPGGEIPDDEEIPLLLDRVYPCHEVVTMDYHLPGCPPSADTLWEALVALLEGRPLVLPYELIKYD